MKRLMILYCLIAAPSLADVTQPNGKVTDCYCTDKNHNRVELGETICLQVDGRMFMAQCQMSLNVPMWREVQQGCLSSQVLPDAGPRQNPVETLGIYPKI